MVFLIRLFDTNRKGRYQMQRYFDLFVYGRSITSDMLDELGHANYNELKKVFELVRYRLCRYLGFTRPVLRKKLGLGLFMKHDSYEYLQPLKLNEWITFIPNIVVDGPAQITITLKVLRHRAAKGDSDDNAGVGTLSNTVIYRMIMVNLKTGKPTRIPKPILRSIERWKEQTIQLMGTFER